VVTAEASTIERFLADARRPLDRVAPGDLAAELAAGALVVDIRPQANREAEGELSGAVVIERIHLEWRLDPTSPDRHPEARPGRKVVVVCNEGFASSLAAWSLRLLGLRDATDLVGGFRAWRRTAAPPTPDEERRPWP
jgi:rhodanese-related sulfurtransferase